MKCTCFGLILIFATMYLLPVIAQNAPAAPQVKYPPREDFDMVAFNDTIKAKINEVNSKLKSKNITGLDYESYSRLFMSWYKHPYTEEATRIDKDWFKTLYDCTSRMSKSKIDMEVDEARNFKEPYEKAKAEYDKMLKVFIATLAKPPKFSDEDYKKLVEQNKKQYNAKKKKQ